MTATALYAAVGLWILGHLAGFFLVLRRHPGTRAERSILVYHLISFGVCCAAALLALALVEGVSPADAAGPVLLHAIYSLSFLEFWALADGGISARLLARAAGEHARLDERDLDAMVGYAEEKQRVRSDSLRRLGLVRGPADSISPTARGRMVAAALRWLQFLNDTRRIG